MPVAEIEPLWSIKEVSEFLGIPINTLYYWRYRGIGPTASRIGRHVRYDPATVRAWVANQENDHG